jgi:hypothetical protein
MKTQQIIWGGDNTPKWLTAWGGGGTSRDMKLSFTLVEVVAHQNPSINYLLSKEATTHEDIADCCLLFDEAVVD